jgi:bacillithiol biosynthesis cysteine-adding enzyme BshC
LAPYKLKILKTLEKIPFLEIESIPILIKDFLSGNLEFAVDKTFSIENVEKQIALKKDSFTLQQRSILNECLKNQSKDLEFTEKQNFHLNALENENTFTITTGHQLNFFTGPVFFIYKILQTIKTAEFLNSSISNAHFVPIFWMATEDHDFEEINHFKTDKNYFEMQAKSGGVVGKIIPNTDLALKEFEEHFKDDVFGTELILLLKKAYQKGNNLSEATRFIVQNLFADYGLLIIDGDEKSLKAQMIPIFKDELLQNSLKNYSEKKVDVLSQKYGKVQVNPRDINLFYLTETRNRVSFENNFYKIIDTDLQFSEEEILKELEEFPEKFSPNALMRPVFQESILPNIAYIGGNAEIMYWLELPDYFDFLKLPFPILIPRNSFLFLNEKTTRKILKLDLNYKDIFKGFPVLIKEKFLDNHEIISTLNTLENDLKKQFLTLKEAAKSTDITFLNLIEAEETRQLKSFDRMAKRLLRAEKIKQKELLERLEKLFNNIHPNGIWQERVCNFSVFYALEGKSWLEFCLSEIEIEFSEMNIAVI